MIKSKYFWTGAILLASIPMFVLDIPKHYVDWTREVHDEIITTVYNQYQYTTKQKTAVLDQILSSNVHLMAAMYLKGFTGIILIGLSIYFFLRAHRVHSVKFWQAFSWSSLLFACAVVIKILSWTSFSNSENVKLLTLSPADTSVQQICLNHFKNQIVYVDFWGTTCGPCLEEFRNFNRPLKAKYHGKSVAYLYICSGQQLIWKQQLKKFEVAGSHIFLDEKDYVRFYRNSTRIDNHSSISMPRYLVVDKHGQIVSTDAPRPSQPDSISTLLDKYLAAN